MTAQKKFLDLTGVQYLVQAIKGIVSDINTAISSKANDSEVLHKAQTETVTGEKTFKKDVKIIDLNANERPGVKFEVNGSFRTFEQAKDSLPDPDFGDFGGGTLWDGGFLADNTKIQNSMGDYVINDITFGTTNYSSVIEFNNYYKVTYEDGHNSPEDVTGMLRFELAPYENVEKDHGYWSDPDLYFYAMLDGSFSGGSTILGNPRAPWSKAYIGEINCEDIKFGGFFSIFDALKNIQKLSYVTHYSSTALTPSSTNSNTLLDNTDNLKVGDKVIDSSGVLFSVTAIDTQNSTFTIGTSLIDLAQDSDVVHNSGDEVVNGVKNFKDLIPIDGGYLGNESSVNARTNICLRSNRDGVGKSGVYVTKYRPNKAQGSMGANDLVYVSFDALENEVRTNGALSIQCTNWLNDVPQKVNIVSGALSYSYGNSTRKALINDLNPGSLSFPDISNGVDISSYLDTSKSSQNYYTPLVDGWICIKGRSSTTSGIAILQGDMAQMGYTLVDFGSSDRVCFCALPVKAGVQVEIWLKSVTTLDSAKFFPCQGNV